MNEKEIFRNSLSGFSKNIRFIEEEKLFKKGNAKVDFSFLYNNSFINVLLLDSKLNLSEEYEKCLEELITYLIKRESIVILLFSKFNEDVCLFIEENIRIINPYFLARRFTIKEQLPLIEFNEGCIPFINLIEAIYNNEIYYYGPKPGYNRVGIELIKDECWNCKRLLFSVTGLVFPNKHIKIWKEEYWNYFHSNLNLSDLPNDLVLQIKDKVDHYRNNYQPNACLIEQNYSSTKKLKYWSTTCPDCKKMRGDFYLNDVRMDYLHNHSESIRNGDIRYLGLDCQISQEILNKLANKYETCAEIIDWKIEENVLQYIGV